MPVLYRGKLYENGRAAQAYLPPDFVRQYGFPLEVGEDVVVQLLPHKGVVLLPADREIVYPIEIQHPQRIDPRASIDNFPIEESPGNLADFEYEEDE